MPDLIPLPTSIPNDDCICSYDDASIYTKFVRPIDANEVITGCIALPR